MSDRITAELVRCLEEYQAAMLELEDRRGAADPSSAERVRLEVEAAEQAILARLALYRCLVNQGWRPPPSVATVLDRDVTVVRMPVGSIGG
ncbi:MAG TPA: hypothetical protein VNA12_01615 [Mycobacteriales bacterium]|nr:hypothetical protein [Mycobacteriales bacterium]